MRVSLKRRSFQGKWVCALIKEVTITLQAINVNNKVRMKAYVVGGAVEIILKITANRSLWFAV